MQDRNTMIEIFQLIKSVGNKGINIITGDKDEHFYSYQRLYRDALSTLAELQKRGIKPGDELVIQLDDKDSYDFMRIFWASILGGIIVVPISVGANEEHRRKLFEIWKLLSNPFIASNSKVIERLKNSSNECIEENIIDEMLERTILLDVSKETIKTKAVIHNSSPSDIAFIQFSSGSTGTPKGVVVTHKMLITNIDAINNRFRTTKKDSFLSWMPLTHDLGLIIFHIAPLIECLDQHIIPTSTFIRRPTLWLKKANDYQVTILSSPNFGYEYFLKRFKHEIALDWELSNIRIILNGAEPISYDLCKSFLTTLAPYGLNEESMYPAYGLAEATVAATIPMGYEKPVAIHLDRTNLKINQLVKEVEYKTENSVTFFEVGKVVDNFSLRIADDNDNELEENIVGHIQIKGENVTKYYYNNEIATESLYTSDGWARTGDVGFLTNENLVITGRFKDIIFSNGQNVYPHDIERVSEEIEEVKLGKIAACGIYNEKNKQEDIVLFLVWSGDPEEFKKVEIKLKNHLYQKAGWLIKEVVPIKKMLKTTSGKIQRYKFAELYTSGKYFTQDQLLEKKKNDMTENIKDNLNSNYQKLNKEELSEWLKKYLDSEELFNEEKSFNEYGIGSLQAISLIGELSDLLGIEISPTVLWEYHTPKSLITYLDSLIDSKPIEKSDVSINELLNENHDIAIIGMDCNFPEAQGLDEFWKLLNEGNDGISEISEHRKEIMNISENELHDVSSKYGGFIENITKFDNDFFNISFREAKSMDPQQRMLLESSWKCFEHANILPSSIKGSDLGIFVGASSSDYLRLQCADKNNIDHYLTTGGATSILANRLSYFYDVHGPSLCIDTACSSSLVAIHQACNSLNNEECNMALAAGVNTLLSNEITTGLAKAKMLSPDGKCKSFDDDANGYVRGEGCGVIILKRLNDAIKDGNKIHAIIKGSAINQDGRSNGLTAPNKKAQIEVINKALKNANVKFKELSYLEAHGTGTSLGDPIEIDSLKMVDSFGNGARGDSSCYIGSVKSNIGHLEAAAGIAGVIKTVLAMKNEVIPRNLNFNTLNKYIDLNGTRFKIPTTNVKWHKAKSYRYAGVSSFGFGGTNAHVILEEYQSQDKFVESKKTNDLKQNTEYYPFFLSSKTEEGLTNLVKDYINFLENSKENIEDICATSVLAREVFAYKISFNVNSIGELRNYLINFLENQKKQESSFSLKSKKTVFMFSGQGKLSINSSKELYVKYPEFKKNMDECEELLKDKLKTPLLDVLYGNTNSERKLLLSDPTYAQCALFSLEYSLAKLWTTFGINPDLLIGHSLGEYVASCIAEELTLKEAIDLVFTRANLMKKYCEKGSMIAILADEKYVAHKLLEYNLEISAINGEKTFIVSGDKDSIYKLNSQVNKDGIQTSILEVPYAFHSKMMDPMLQDYKKELQKLKFKESTIPIVSTLTGKVKLSSDSTDYWIKHTRKKVDFLGGLKTLKESEEEYLIIEIGPESTLTNLSRNYFKDNKHTLVASISDKNKELKSFSAAICQVYSQTKILFPRQLFKENINLVTLPTYNFVDVNGVNKNNSFLSDFKKGELGVLMNKQNDIREEIKDNLIMMFSDLLHSEPNQVNTMSPLLEIGADSLILMEVIQKIKKEYNLTFSIRSFFENIKNIDDLSESIYSQVGMNIRNKELTLRKEKVNNVNRNEHYTNSVENDLLDKTYLKVSEISEAESVEGLTITDLMKEQLSVLEKVMKHQLESYNSFLTENRNSDKSLYSENNKNEIRITNKNQALESYKTSDKKESSHINTLIEDDLYKKKIVSDLSNKTKKSKEWIEKYRPVLADYRGASGFKLSTKEIHYIPVAAKAKGSKFWDIDGNEYIDLTMGFGVNLFGHDPEFIKNTLKAEIETGYALGPQSKNAGKVAQLITEMTGMERVTFCNSGTEAVMASLRLARAVTKKNKIVIFSGSYHGTSDEVISSMFASPGEKKLNDIVPGIPEGLSQNIIVLEYGSELALQEIEENIEEIAAVLVEPVQSRKPELQPVEFLKNLREITELNNTALIFDEVITGFRTHLGGVQKIFGIKADMAIYGKVLGGGMHLGVVAGNKKFLNAVDGGTWNFGDESYPKDETTLIAGTFCKHPLTMSASLAVLEYFKKDNGQLQLELNLKTQSLVKELNDFFEEVNVPINVVNFGSLFRFTHKSNLDYFFYKILEKGIYIWEGKNCFLSTAHSEEDLKRIVEVIKSVTLELINNGFFPTAILKTDKSIFKPEKNIVPVYEDQKEMWLLSQLSEDSSRSCNELVSLEIDGNIKFEQLNQALNFLLKKHESLRVKFNATGEQQEIIKFEENNFKIKKSSLAKSENIDEVIQTILQTNFDLSNGPLFSCELINTIDKNYLIFIAHHTIVDGFSIGLFLEELLEKYSEINEGTFSENETSLSLKEYVDWRIELESSRDREENNEYWKKVLIDSDLAINLPVDFSRKNKKSYRGAANQLKIDTNLANQVKAFCQKNRITPNMFFLSVFSLMIEKTSRQKNMVIGTPYALRDLEGGHQYVGYGVNLLPIKLNVNNQQTFYELINDTKNSLFEAYSHSNFSFNKVFRGNNTKKQESQNIEVVFNYERRLHLPKIDEMTVSLYQPPIKYSKYELSLNVMEFMDEINLDITFNTDLFKNETIFNFLNMYKNLITKVLEKPMDKLSNLSLLSKQQSLDMVNEIYQSSKETNNYSCIHEMFEKQVKRTPNDIAVIFENEKISYTELNKKANQLANYLRKNGVGPDTLVGISINRSIDMVVSMLGVLKAGGAYVPIDYSYPKERIDFIVKDTKLSSIISNSQFMEKFSEFQINKINMNTIWNKIEIESEENLSKITTPRNLAYVIYTSGSTGEPKGVLVEHRGVCNLIQFRQENFSLDNNDKLLQTYHVCFDAAVWTFWWPLASGSSLVLGADENYKDPNYLVQLSIENDISVIGLVPSMLEQFLKNKNVNKLNSLKYIICGGEPLPTISVKKLSELLPEVTLINAYGPTEATIDTTNYICEKNSLSATQSIGKPLNNVEVYILDEALNLLPQGVPGELFIGGVGVARGYLNRPDLTEQKFIKNPYANKMDEYLYKTGDLGKYSDNGNIEFLGRIDNQIKLRGYRIELGEIETQLLAHDEIEEAVVIIKEDNKNNKQLIAYLVSTNKKRSLNYDFELENTLRNHLPEYMLPTAYIFLDELPKLSNGKIDHKVLPDLRDEDYRYNSVKISPVQPIDKVLVLVWNELLDAQEIGIEDNFFRLGGNSLNAIQVISQLEDIFSLTLSVNEIFENPTIKELSNCLLKKNNYIELNEIAEIYLEVSQFNEDEIENQLNLLNMEENSVE